MTPDKLLEMFYYAWDAFYEDEPQEMKMFKLLQSVARKEMADNTFRSRNRRLSSQVFGREVSGKKSMGRFERNSKQEFDVDRTNDGVPWDFPQSKTHWVNNGTTISDTGWSLPLDPGNRCALTSQYFRGLEQKAFNRGSMVNTATGPLTQQINLPAAHNTSVLIVSHPLIILCFEDAAASKKRRENENHDITNRLMPNYSIQHCCPK